jgi:hypothetical protein
MSNQDYYNQGGYPQQPQPVSCKAKPIGRNPAYGNLPESVLLTRNTPSSQYILLFNLRSRPPFFPWFFFRGFFFPGVMSPPHKQFPSIPAKHTL